MVHYGKHIIDPATGLCEICDRGAIHELKHGKRPGKQFLYSNQDGKFTYRSTDDELNHQYDETTPRYVRKPLYPEPPPPARTRPVVHEEPVVVQKKVTRRDRSPYDDHEHSSPARPATFYYVDNTGQMIPQNEGPPDETRRHHPVQNHQLSPTRPARTTHHRAQTPPEEPRRHHPNQIHHTSPARPARVVHHRAQTPPVETRRHHPVQNHHTSPTRPARVAHRRAQTPPANDSWRSPPKRQNNSDTEIIHRTNPNDYYYDQSPRKAELYYIEGPQHGNHYSTLNSLVLPTIDHHTPSPRIIHQGDTNKKQRQLEPIERKYRTEPEPTVSRKVYKKLPPSRHQPTEEEYFPNGNHAQPARKIEKIYPPPTKYVSSPQLINEHVGSPLSNHHHPSMYYLQTVNGY